MKRKKPTDSMASLDAADKLINLASESYSIGRALSRIPSPLAKSGSEKLIAAARFAEELATRMLESVEEQRTK